jgi:activator of HSP90 ATPase
MVILTADRIGNVQLMQACVSQRKAGKKLAVYDLNITVSWEGKMVVADSKQVKGIIKIHEFASASEQDDWVLECSTTDTGEDAVRFHLLRICLQGLVVIQCRWLSYSCLEKETHSTVCSSHLANKYGHCGVK